MVGKHRYVFGHNALAVALLSVAMSVLLVGVVWASSSAIIGGDETGDTSPVESTVPNDQQSSPDNTNTPNEAGSYDDQLRDLRARLDEIDRDISTAVDSVAAVSESSTKMKSDIDQISDQLGDLATEVSSLKKEFENTKKVVLSFDERLTSLSAILEKKTVLLDDEGKYIGSVAPSQISPQLRVSDVAGDWPLKRTTGELHASKIYSDLFGCNSDWQNNAVVTIDAFRRLACIRIPK